jgi:hypothetical protein
MFLWEEAAMMAIYVQNRIPHCILKTRQYMSFPLVVNRGNGPDSHSLGLYILSRVHFD